MAKVDTDKFIALLIETYCRRQGIDRTIASTILDDVLEKMGLRVEDGRIVEIPEKEPISERAIEVLDRHLKDFPLSVRTLNILIAGDIYTVRDLVQYGKTDILKFRLAGKRVLDELDNFLKGYDLHWGMKNV